jgi:hypothetical protein
MGILLRCHGKKRLGPVVASVLERYAREAGLAGDDARQLALRTTRVLSRAPATSVGLRCEEKAGRIDVVVEPVTPASPGS